LTLAYTPPIDAAHKEEAMRVQLEAHLHQERLDSDTGEIGWESRLTLLARASSRSWTLTNPAGSSRRRSVAAMP
jgi:hypothetical protein